MKLSFTLFFTLLISLTSGWSQTQNIEVSHNIDAVTLYLNNAEIQRSASVEIPAGKSDLLFKNISSRIFDRGVKIGLSNEVKVYALNIEQDKEYVENQPAFQIIKRQKNEVALQLDSFKMELEILDRQLDYLDANMTIENTSFEQIDRGAEYFNKKISAIQQSIFKKTQHQNKLNEKLDSLDRESNLIKSRLSKTNKIIRITVISNKAINTDIDLRYLVTNALWQPSYAIRANENNPTIKIEYQAQIYNDTGNDWNNMPLTLAIVDASSDISKPDLQVWTLEEYSNKSAKSKKGKYAFTHDLNPDKRYDKEVENNILELDNLSTRFELKDLHDIPSDATPHLVDVNEYEKTVDFYTLSIPKVKNGAFKIAQIIDWENLGLIDGKASLYYNNTYQGSTYLKTQEINDTLEVALGLENTFTVSRQKLSSKSRKSLIGFNIKEIITYEFQVKNNTAKAAQIEIRDQIPVSTSKDIEVKLLQKDGAKLDPLTGQLNWDIDLAPNELKKITFIFSIKYPKSKKNWIKQQTKIIVSPRYF